MCNLFSDNLEMDTENIKLIIVFLQSKGLTQKQIATELGCSQSNISSFLHGKQGTVRPSSKVVDGLRKLAVHYGMTPSVYQSIDIFP